MKTAEEWLANLIGLKPTDTFSTDWLITGKDLHEDIKQIQLDAWKQGMRDAANLVENYELIERYNIPHHDEIVLSDVLTKINTACENKTQI